MNDHDLLVRIDERVEAIHAAVFGNGQPGLSTRVAQLEGKETKVAAKGAAGVAILALVLAFVAKLLGLPLG